MGVVKVIELVGTSPNNWTEAADNAAREASRTLDNITGFEVINFTASVDEGRVAEYKANVKVAFRVH